MRACAEQQTVPALGTAFGPRTMAKVSSERHLRISPPNFDLAPNLRQEERRRNCTIRSDAPPSSESITSSLVGREVKALGKTLNETVIPRKVLE